MSFDFSKITVSELDKALESPRFSAEVRAAIALTTGQTVEELGKLPASEYKKLLAGFIKAAFAPVDADPN